METPVALLDVALDAPFITRVTIGRLHNLGNYEHVRYEITVDVPADKSADPLKVIADLDALLAGMEPKPPTGAWEITYARNVMANPERFTDAQKADAQNVLAVHDAWVKRRAAHLATFHAYGGRAEHKDAKLDWNDDADAG